MPRQNTGSVAEDDADNPITLGILNAVEDNSNLTQRSIANDLGIALGLANAYLKRCVRKGLIKVQQVPANRYAYYLTPKGFAEKSRLTSEYLTSSFTFFRKARIECTALLEECAASRHQTLALYGVSDLADVMALSCLETDLTIRAIVDRSVRIDSYAGLPVVPSLDGLPDIDAVILTALVSPQRSYQALRDSHPGIPVFAPPMLGIRAAGPAAREGAA